MKYAIYLDYIRYKTHKALQLIVYNTDKLEHSFIFDFFKFKLVSSKEKHSQIDQITHFKRYFQLYL